MNLTIGLSGADINGNTGVAIQAGLDRVGTLGGGKITVLPGVYTLWNRLRMPSNTRLTGFGEGTILRKADGWSAPLWEDGDWGDEWACCDPLPPVTVGHGVLVRSNRGGGFLSTVGTVVEIVGTRMRLNARFNCDYMVADGATASSAHPLISVDGSENIEIDNLVLDGNAANNPRMDGCRGGGIWGLFAGKATIANVTVRNINGDGISFQNCRDWVVEDCLFEDNIGGGMHPGSGSQRPIIRRCVSRRNGGWGMFVCWRVKHGLFEENVLEDNTAGGISIGHKDTDNLFRLNRICRNAGPGIGMRDETFPMAPHRCTYEANTLEENNAGGAQVVITGQVHDLVFRNNIFAFGVRRYDVGPGVVNLVTEEEVAAGA